MNHLFDVRLPGLGLAPARHASAVNEAERLAYFGDKFDRANGEVCISETDAQSGSRRPSPAPKAALGASAR